jgi:seryl-tRNA synthetase
MRKVRKVLPLYPPEVYEDEDFDRYSQINKQEEKMETKSRYEVISDLEKQKRELIRERDGFTDKVNAMQKQVTEIDRQKSDTIMVLDRKKEDLELEITNFKTSADERKETIKELIKSIDESLERLGKLASKEK